MIAQSQATCRAQPGQAGRHLGPVELVRRRRRPGKRRSPTGRTQIAGYEKFRGKLGDDAKTLAACLQFDTDFDRAGERLGTYAFLKTAEDTANSDYQRMIGRYRNAASRAAQAASYIRPEIMAIPAKTMKTLPGRQAAGRVSPAARAAAALQAAHARRRAKRSCWPCRAKCPTPPNQIFRQLNDADLKWGTIKNERGELVELSNASFSSFLHSPDASVRKTGLPPVLRAVRGPREHAGRHAGGSIQRDVYYAQARGYTSALAASLFPDNVPLAVYDNLIASVHRHLPALYRYYDLRRRKMKLTRYPPLRHLRADPQRARRRGTPGTRRSKLVIAALEPLGSEYCGALEEGSAAAGAIATRTRASRAARSAAGSYDGDPYILMNYQPDVLDHVFTLAHEAGHSMHSYYSAKHQPFQYYNYTIFVAEVASTFNEQLLSQHLMRKASDDQQRAFLINREIDAIRGTILRQTMFAEFEKITHALAEAGEPLTVERFKSEYRKLLERISGPTSRSTPSCRWSAFAFRTSIGRFTSTSTPPACRPRSPWPNASTSGGARGARRLSRLSQGRLLEIPARPAARRRRRHGAAARRRHGARLFRPAGGRVG